MSADKTVEDWLKEEGAAVAEGAPNRELSVAEFLAQDSVVPGQAADESDLYAEPSPIVKLPVPFVFGETTISELKLRPMPRAAEILLGEEPSTDVKQRVEHSLRFMSLLIQEAGGVERGPDNKDRADVFVEMLRKCPIQNESAIMIGARMLSVHFPAGKVSGRKFRYPGYCRDSRCQHYHKPFDHSVRLDKLKVTVADSASVEGQPNVIEETGMEWRYLTMGDKASIFRLKDQLKSSPMEFDNGIMWLHMVKLPGVDRITLRHIQDLPRGPKNILRSRLNHAGVHTMLNHVCPSCGKSWDAQLPWEHASFFHPSENDSDEAKNPTTSCRF